MRLGLVIALCAAAGRAQDETATPVPTALDEKDPYLYCGLYTFTEDTKARGPDTSTASFDVSWKDEVPGCMYADASNYNSAATVDDLSCVFDVAGCPYAAAANHNPDATVDDGSCVFDDPAPPVPAEVTGSFCVSGDVSKDVLDEFKDELRDDIAEELGVAKDNVTITTASGGCETRRRRLQATSDIKFVYAVETDSVAGEPMVSKCSAMMGDLGAVVDAVKKYIRDKLNKGGNPDLAPCLCPEELPCGECPLDALALTSLGDPELIMLESPTPEPTSELTPVLGCKYKAATNFNPLATVDDDSCMFATSGCTYQAASNYNSEATDDDGSCIFAPVCKPCSDDTECELDEFCEFKEDGGRRLRFGSIQREGCCRAP